MPRAASQSKSGTIHEVVSIVPGRRSQTSLQLWVLVNDPRKVLL